MIRTKTMRKMITFVRKLQGRKPDITDLVRFGEEQHNGSLKWVV